MRTILLVLAVAGRRRGLVLRCADSYDKAGIDKLIDDAFVQVATRVKSITELTPNAAVDAFAAVFAAFPGCSVTHSDAIVEVDASVLRVDLNDPTTLAQLEELPPDLKAQVQDITDELVKRRISQN